MLSEILWEKFRFGTGFCEPFIIHMPDFNQGERLVFCSMVLMIHQQYINVSCCYQAPSGKKRTKENNKMIKATNQPTNKSATTYLMVIRFFLPSLASTS
jgi:hypothetical protein